MRSAWSAGPGRLSEYQAVSYRVAGSSMKKKKKGIALSSGDQVRQRVRSQEERDGRVPSTFSRQPFPCRASSCVRRPGLARGRKRQTGLSFWGRGHVTVTVIALFPTVQYHLSNLCPEEEPLSSFGFAPLSLSFQW